MVDMRSGNDAPRLPGPRCSGHRSDGFTLMEVMVALSVVAIALLAIYRMHTQTLFMDARGRFDTRATMRGHTIVRLLAAIWT